jgi:hypothetical protein
MHQVGFAFRINGNAQQTTCCRRVLYVYPFYECFFVVFSILALLFSLYQAGIAAAQGNTSLGTGALQNNNTGTNSTAIGVDALFSNTIGGLKTAIGVNSLFSNTEGVRNTAIGVDALFTNITGDSNVAIGYQALAFGAYAGSFNIAIGSNADVHGNVTNATAIGFAALVDASNKIRPGKRFCHGD